MGIGSISGAWGAFYGLVIEAKFVPGLISGRLINEIWWKKFARFGLAMLIAYPWILVSKIIDALDPDNPYAILIF